MVTCPTLIAYSRDSDNVEREIETIAARYPVAHPGHDEFPNVIVYSSSDEWLADGASDVPMRVGFNERAADS